MTTATLPTISNNLGELTINDGGWSAMINSEASKAMSAIDWNGELLQVTFRRKAGDPVVYDYNVRNDADAILLDEIQAVLNGVEDASIGVMFNRLVKANEIISID